VGAGDSKIQAGQQLFQRFTSLALQHGQCVPSLVSDGDAFLEGRYNPDGDSPACDGIFNVGQFSIVPSTDGADILPTCLHFLSGMSETVTARTLLLLPSRPSRYLLRQAKTWLALIACRCATRATDAPAP
jgi:hypothetical protein